MKSLHSKVWIAKIIFIAILFSTNSIDSFAQSGSSVVISKVRTYTLSITPSDVNDWTAFENYISNITQSKSIRFNAAKNEITITTFRNLDPKVIEGKLIKYGVEFVNLKED